MKPHDGYKEPLASGNDRDGISRRCALLVISSALALTALPASMARGAEAARLRVRFTKGQVLRYVMTMRTNVNVTKDGNELKQSMVNDTVFKWKVREVSPDGMATIEQVNERSRLDLKNPGVNIQFDTAKPVNEKKQEFPSEFQALTDGLRNTIGKPITLTVDPRGEIQKITFSREFLDAIGMSQEFMEFGFKRDKPLKRLGELGLTALPTKSLAVGESEEESKSVDSPLASEPVKYRFKYTRRPDERIAGRDAKRIDYSLDLNPASFNLGATQYDVSGSIRLDVRRGVITDIDLRRVLAVDLGQATGGLIKNNNKQVLTRTTRLLAAEEDPFADQAK
ncbi:MAG TPA: hypothetical protein VGP63_22900 [Planctomycetaceae bacterium]|jgi:hypothetical protein|nr:hypothetical protein [Planctomycetaceae bacterium]